MKEALKFVVLGALFAVPFLTLYVENDYFFPFITGKNFWFRILVDVAFAAWILLALYEPKYRPKFSWILGGFSVLLVVMFFANLFGVHPRSSFWSNFERMDGYVSLIHTGMYMLMLGCMLQTKQLWQRFLNVSLVVAFAVALYGLAQYGGLVEGTSRIDSRLGNAAYMAVYMLFHIFFAFWLFVDSKNISHKVIYALFAALFTFVLIETGTRGTALGLAAGLLVMSAYIGLFGTQFREFRKYAIGIFIVLVLAVGGFIVGRDTEIVQSNPNLARIANISFDDLTIRATIWGLGLEGVKERPLLGYGQSNFNFVFNEHYDPALYAQEQWFDRSHNIFVDWLVTGGILGLLSYLSIFAACAWYLLIRPLIKKDETFTVLERGVLLGILAGYFTHNFVVFDNIVSYIFFAAVLGLIHSRVSRPIQKIEKVKVDESIIIQIAVPAVVVLLGATIYFFHAPGMLAAGDIIDGFRSAEPIERLNAFKRAIDRDSFAQQEITEQLSQQVLTVMRTQSISQEIKAQYITYAEEQFERLLREKPGDARIEVFIGSFYRTINDLDKATIHMQKAHELSPGKPSIIVQQGVIELSRGDNTKALEYMLQAYELDTRNPEAREYLAVAYLANKEQEKALALMDSEVLKKRFAQNDYMVSVANKAGMYDFAIEILKYRLQQDSSKAQNWASLAYLQIQNGQQNDALETLANGATAVPSFEPMATCVSENIKNNRTPDEGC